MGDNVEHRSYRRADGTIWTRRQEYYYPGTRQHRIVWVDAGGGRSLSGSGPWKELEEELTDGRLTAVETDPGA